MTKQIDCAFCGRRIDAGARLCPFCGADPESGRKFDTTPLVQSHFPPKVELGPRERLLDFVRTRQTLVLTAIIVVIALAAIGVHQMVNRREAAEAAANAGLPLTELADLSNRPQQTPQLPLPDLEYQTGGDLRRVRTLLLEPGAVAPQAPTPAPPAAGSPRPALGGAPVVTPRRSAGPTPPSR